MNAGEVKIAAELAVDAHQHIEIEARGDAGGIVVGVVENALVLLEVDADDHLRAAAQNVARGAQEGGRFMRLEIAERRSREKPDLRHPGDLGRQCERCGKVGRDRINAEIREILAQRVGLALKEIAGDIDGNIGAKLTALEQQADLGGRAGAELDQRRAFGEEACDFAAPVAQNAELGAGRVIFRQYA